MSRARSAVAIALLAGASLAAGSMAHGQRPVPACRTGDDAAGLRASLVEMMVGIDSESVATRAMYGVRHVPPARVRVVSDTALCRQAARAYYRHALGPPSARGVVVVEIGDAYAVYGDSRAGEWTILTIFNRAWQPRAHIAH